MHPGISIVNLNVRQGCFLDAVLEKKHEHFHSLKKEKKPV